jgi:hypothetical protein
LLYKANAGVYKTVNLIFPYGCEAWALMLDVGHRLAKLSVENKAPRKISERKRRPNMRRQKTA